MPGKFDKNFTTHGYLMNYNNVKAFSPCKNWVLQFKIELPEILPLIWRRILVPSNYNFWDLHIALQDSMGWLDYHLHHFEIKAKRRRKAIRIGIPDFDRLGELEEVFPGWEIPVLEYFNDLGITAKYLYDYGDSWWHTVQLEGYMFRDRKIDYPICIDGERACPPEDCGGVSGYYNVLKTLSNPHDEDFKGMREWVGEHWNSESFNKDTIEFDDPYKRWVYAFLKK